MIQTRIKHYKKSSVNSIVYNFKKWAAEVVKRFTGVITLPKPIINNV